MNTPDGPTHQQPTIEALQQELQSLKQAFDASNALHEKEINELKQALAAVQSQEASFRQVADKAKVIISIVADEVGNNLLYVNEEWTRVYGYSKEEAMKLKPIDFVAPEQRAFILENAAKRMMEKDPLTRYELKTITKSGEIKYFDFSPSIIQYNGRKAFLTTAIDITAQKKAEDKLRKSEAKQTEMNAQKDKLFSIISHDLISPFNSILGFSDLLLECIQENDLSGLESYATIIKQSAEQTLELLKNLLEWSRTQIGGTQFLPEIFDLGEVVLEIKGLLNVIAGKKQITIHHTPFSSTQVFADRSMLGTILRNLVSNAIKFTREGGDIFITAEKRTEDVLISVRDNGIGIESSRLSTLFRMDQSQSTFGTHNEKGTGLGLILCKEFVERHGGSMWATSEAGKGSTFSFTLPCPGYFPQSYV